MNQPSPPVARRSLRSRMLWRVLLPLAATWSMGSAVAFYLSWVLAGHAFDRALLDDAYAIAANIGTAGGRLVVNLTQGEIDKVLFDRDEREYYTVYAADGRIVASSATLEPAPPTAGAPTAGQTAEFSDGAMAGATLRLATLRGGGSAGGYTVVVGETTRSRDSLLRGLLGRSIAPQLVLLLVLGAYLSRQISRELAPLDRLQRELDLRHSSDLGPVVLEARSSDVVHLRDAVNALLARIDRAVQAQKEFAGNVAHELRTPLAGIRALAEYGLTQQAPVVWRQQLGSIVASEERASRLVDQLLALALADEARESVRLERIRVDELARQTLISFMGAADAAGVDLEASGLDAPVEAWGSPVLLEGALGNLIDNALRYGCRVAEPTLTLAVESGDGRVRIALVDRGPGIDDRQREALSRRWTQGLAGVRLGQGAGLGLAIASRYADLMGGRLLLESGDGGRGLRAVVELNAGPPS